MNKNPTLKGGVSVCIWISEDFILMVCGKRLLNPFWQGIPAGFG